MRRSAAGPFEGSSHHQTPAAVDQSPELVAMSVSAHTTPRLWPHACPAVLTSPQERMADVHRPFVFVGSASTLPPADRHREPHDENQRTVTSGSCARLSPLGAKDL
jgi:hypothetical protein